jgi:hypothetical protein
LVAAAFVAIRRLLSPQETLAFRRTDVQWLADGDLVLSESVEVKRTLIRTYGKEFVSEEERNNRKLDVVSRAGLLLMIGVVALACEGGTRLHGFKRLPCVRLTCSSRALRCRRIRAS